MHRGFKLGVEGRERGGRLTVGEKGAQGGAPAAELTDMEKLERHPEEDGGVD